ncbi:MAG: hypothetical protein ACFFDN_45155 [Candidatus Hodarchaeota archaeon]
MPTCYHCGNQYTDDFQCSQCGQNYCSLHRDPIEHECNIVKETISMQEIQTSTRYSQELPQDSLFSQNSSYQQSDTSSLVRGTTDGSFTWHRQEYMVPENAFSPDSGIKFRGILFPYKSELVHFLVGGFLIFVIGLINFYDLQLIQLNFTWAIFMLAGFYTAAFLLHEFGHRQVAKHFGLQTKFRLLTFGMILTLFGLIAGLFSLLTNSPALPSLALPGAVVVLGLDKIDRKTGLCKAAGPLVNLIFGSILLVISAFIPNPLYPLNMFFGFAAALNFTLGAFNLIPIGILDGQNIIKWNKKVYAFLMSTLLILLIITYILIYTPELSFYFP